MNAIIDLFRALLPSWPEWALCFPVLGCGLSAAYLTRHGLAFVCRVLAVDRLAARSWLGEFLRKGSVLSPLSKLLGIAAHWVLMGITLFTIARLIDKELVNTLTTRASLLLPELLAAVLVCVIGVVAAGFVSNIARTFAGNAGISNADVLGRVVRWAGYMVVAALAVDQLGFAKALLSPLFHITYAAVMLGLALAFGLGCRDLAKDCVVRLVRELRERSRAGSKSDLEG